MRGTVPSLLGRWLVASVVKLPNNTERPIPSVWEIVPGEGHENLTIRFVDLPAPQKQTIEELNKKGQGWTPTAADLRAIASQWDDLPVSTAAAVAEVATEIVGRDGFDDAFKTEPKSKDAVWVIRQALTMQRSAAPVVRGVNIYATLDEKDGVPRGNLVTATIAVAPFPVPITFEGSFALYRLPDVPPSLGQRVRRFLKSRGWL